MRAWVSERTDGTRGGRGGRAGMLRVPYTVYSIDHPSVRHMIWAPHMPQTSAGVASRAPVPTVVWCTIAALPLVLRPGNATTTAAALDPATLSEASMETPKLTYSTFPGQPTVAAAPQFFTAAAAGDMREAVSAGTAVSGHI